jgi:hypothetical protein
MNDVINGWEKLAGISTDQKALKKLLLGARLHRRYSRIYFEILQSTPQFFLVSVTQKASPSDNYFDIARLTEIAREMWLPVLPPNMQLQLVVATFDAAE